MVLSAHVNCLNTTAFAGVATTSSSGAQKEEMRKFVSEQTSSTKPADHRLPSSIFTNDFQAVSTVRVEGYIPENLHDRLPAIPESTQREGNG